MALASTGAQWRSKSPSSENSLMTTGWGALVRSPIMSCRSCGNSTSSTGSASRDLGAHVGDHFVAGSRSFVRSGFASE